MLHVTYTWVSLRIHLGVAGEYVFSDYSMQLNTDPDRQMQRAACNFGGAGGYGGFDGISQLAVARCVEAEALPYFNQDDDDILIAYAARVTPRRRPPQSARGYDTLYHGHTDISLHTNDLAAAELARWSPGALPDNMPVSVVSQQRLD